MAGLVPLNTLTESDDLNNINQTCISYIKNGNYPINTPSFIGGKVFICFKGTNFIMQMILGFENIWVRTYFYTWYNWYRFDGVELS